MLMKNVFVFCFWLLGSSAFVLFDIPKGGTQAGSEWMIKLKSQDNLDHFPRIRRLINEYGLSVVTEHIPIVSGESAFEGFCVSGSLAKVQELSKFIEITLGTQFIEHVEPNLEFQAQTVQRGARYHLERITKRNLTAMEGIYSYTKTGKGVHAYIMDSGIRLTHEEFEGRADALYNFFDPTNPNVGDCFGHGSHVSGIVGGKTYGVAKSISLHAVKVLNCSGGGTVDSLVAGFNFLKQNSSLPQPMIIVLSLAGGNSAIVDSAAQSLLNKAVIVVAAGNLAMDACTVSPANVQGVITVGATNETDGMCSFSNFGSCVDMWAPGNSVYSAWMGSDTEIYIASGTSQAAPIVAGVVALVLEDKMAKGDQSSVTLQAILNANNTKNVLLGLGANSVNDLIFSPYADNITQYGTGSSPMPSLFVFFFTFFYLFISFLN